MDQGDQNQNGDEMPNDQVFDLFNDDQAYGDWANNVEAEMPNNSNEQNGSDHGFSTQSGAHQANPYDYPVAQISHQSGNGYTIQPSLEQGYQLGSQNDQSDNQLGFQPGNQPGYQQSYQVNNQNNNQGSQLGSQYGVQSNQSDNPQDAQQAGSQLGNEPGSQSGNQGGGNQHFPPINWDSEADNALMFAMVINACGNGQSRECKKPKVPWPNVAASMQAMGYKITKDSANQRFLKHLIKDYPTKYEELRKLHPFNSNGQGDDQSDDDDEDDDDDEGTFSRRASYRGRKPRQKRASTRAPRRSTRKSLAKPKEEADAPSLGSNADRSATREPLELPHRPLSAMSSIRNSNNTPSSLRGSTQNTNQQGQGMNMRNSGGHGTLRLNEQTNTYHLSDLAGQNEIDTSHLYTAQQGGLSMGSYAGMLSYPQSNIQYWLNNIRANQGQFDANISPALLQGHLLHLRESQSYPELSRYTLPRNYNVRAQGGASTGSQGSQGGQAASQSTNMQSGTGGGQATSAPNQGVSTQGNTAGSQGRQSIFGGPGPGQNMGTSNNTPAPQTVQNSPVPGQNAGMQSNAQGNQGFQGGPQGGQIDRFQSTTPVQPQVSSQASQNAGMRSNAPGNQRSQNRPQGGQSVVRQSAQQQGGSRATQNTGMQSSTPVQQQNRQQQGSRQTGQNVRTQPATPTQQQGGSQPGPNVGMRTSMPAQPQQSGSRPGQTVSMPSATPMQQQSGSQAGQNTGMQGSVPTQPRQNQQARVQRGPNTNMQAATTPVQQQTGSRSGGNVGTQMTVPSQQQNVPRAGQNTGMQAAAASQQQQQQQANPQVGQNVGMQGTMPTQAQQGQQSGTMNEGNMGNVGAAQNVQSTEVSQPMDMDTPRQPDSIPAGFGTYAAQHGLQTPTVSPQHHLQQQQQQFNAPVANMGMHGLPAPAQQGPEDPQGLKRRAADDSDTDVKRRKTYDFDNPDSGSY
ncbi:hypothetical protein F5B19DRAFT_492264 [Rostrohypoxylon terebratum]|nr:hypothetical protein F5B19DRAFT_492264 [Rostrohypoxylon terebratum]